MVQQGTDGGWESCGEQVAGVNWAGGDDSVTHGIWMYSRPFVIIHPDTKKKVSILPYCYIIRELAIHTFCFETVEKM